MLCFWLLIQTDVDLEWKLIKPDVFAAIMDFFTSGLPVVNEEDTPRADTGMEQTNTLYRCTHTKMTVQSYIVCNKKRGEIILLFVKKMYS